MLRGERCRGSRRSWRWPRQSSTHRRVSRRSSLAATGKEKHAHTCAHIVCCSRVLWAAEGAMIVEVVCRAPHTQEEDNWERNARARGVGINANPLCKRRRHQRGTDSPLGVGDQSLYGCVCAYVSHRQNLRPESREENRCGHFLMCPKLGTSDFLWHVSVSPSG